MQLLMNESRTYPSVRVAAAARSCRPSPEIHKIRKPFISAVDWNEGPQPGVSGDGKRKG